VGDGEETHADVVELVGGEIVGVAARDNNVAEGRRGRDVVEHGVPALAGRLEAMLGYSVGVGADGVGASAWEGLGGC